MTHEPTYPFDSTTTVVARGQAGPSPAQREDSGQGRLPRGLVPSLLRPLAVATRVLRARDATRVPTFDAGALWRWRWPGRT